jgi:ribulose-bisphosphate carboxylase large chain
MTAGPVPRTGGGEGRGLIVSSKCAGRLFAARDMRITVTYRVASTTEDIEAKAQSLAVEQSVEMPLDAIDDSHVLADIVGKVESIEPSDPGFYLVRVALAAVTLGDEPGQLMNMLFGNSSLHDFVTLENIELSAALTRRFGGPRSGIAGLRERAGAHGRAMTCAALKPQGLPPRALAGLAARFALGGVDYIKDDHALADQDYSPFVARVQACAAAVREASDETGRLTRYVPNLSGNLDQLRAQLAVAADEGIDTVVIAPMVVGLSAFHTVACEHPGIAFIAHPAMGGAARIAPPLLLGRLFRLFGADAVIFPNYGGRFGYSSATCAAIAEAARGRWNDVAPALPVPAGGMTPARLPELLEFYGAEAMILIGGGLLSARERLTSETAAFVARVAELSRELSA